MKEHDSIKMEFLLTLNDNIVVQRFFNVKGFNPEAKNSTEFYHPYPRSYSITSK
jgi:hypothetical protein